MLVDTAHIFCHLLGGVNPQAISKLKQTRSELCMCILRSHSWTISAMAKPGWEHPPHPAPAPPFPHGRDNAAASAEALQVNK